MRRPDYFDRFHCIGGVCTDTCCAGWEIEVDEESCSRYLAMTGSIGNRLRKELTVTPEESYFALKDGRCPFLNKEGLCDLIVAEGEDILCDICREHPRFYNWYGSRTEAGLGLCCEEAERLLFADSRPAVFTEDPEDNAEIEETEEEIFVERMMKARETAFKIVQNRALPLSVRLVILQKFGEELQILLDEERLEELEELYDAFLNRAEEIVCGKASADLISDLLLEYAKLEALDETWPLLLSETAKEAETLLLQSPAFYDACPQTAWEYEHLIVYFINRYFMESVFDMDVLSKVRFGLAALVIIRLLDISSWNRTGQRSSRDRDEIVRRYSKEIEYCPENVSALTEKCWTLEALQTDSFNVMLNALF